MTGVKDQNKLISALHSKIVGEGCFELLNLAPDNGEGAVALIVKPIGGCDLNGQVVAKLKRLTRELIEINSKITH